MTLHWNFKLEFSKRTLDLIRGFLFYFGVIWDVWLPVLIISEKMVIVKQGMSDWLGSDGKMTSRNNFKLGFSKRSFDLIKGFYFKFDVIWEVWLPWTLIRFKIGHCNARNVRLAGQRQKNDITQQLQTKMFQSSFWI